MNKGKIKQVIGPTADIEFHSDSLPDILNAIVCTRADGTTLTVEVAQHVGNNVVRCVRIGETHGDGVDVGVVYFDRGRTGYQDRRRAGRAWGVVTAAAAGLGNTRDADTFSKRIRRATKKDQNSQQGHAKPTRDFPPPAVNLHHIKNTFSPNYSRRGVKGMVSLD